MSTHDSPTKQHPSHFPDPTVIDRVANFIERFIFLPNRNVYRLIATWIVATYMHVCFDYAPYLFIHSPEPGCAKTLLLDTLDPLVSNSSGVLVSPTQSMLFRTAKDCVQLMDEVDSWTNKDELRSVLNAGFKRGGVVKRMEPSGQGGVYTPKDFPVYGPRAFAGIGLGILHGTTKDRAFSIEMKKKQKGEEGRERFRRRNCEGEINALKDELKKWAEAHKPQVESCYAKGAFPYLDGFGDRTIDISEPLAAIHEVAYSGHPRLIETRLELLEAVAATRKDKPEAIVDHRILLELLRLAEVEDPLVGNASELAARCTELPEDSNAYTISQVLRRYSFDTKSARKDGGMPKYRYELPRSALADLVSRYVGSESGEQTDAEASEPTTTEQTETLAA